MRSTRPRRVTVALLLLVAAVPVCAVIADAAGSTAVIAATQQARDEPPSRRVPTAAAPRLSCGGLGFAPGVLKRSRDFELGESSRARALRRFLRRGAEEVGQARRGWFLLARDSRTFEVASGRLPDLGYMTFERRGRGWEWAGSGGCRPRAFDGAREAVTWRPDRSEPAATAEATRLPVLVQEDDCASGDDASGRVLSPLVHYGITRITVTYFVRPLRGARTCQGAPPTPVTLVLDEPLGQRILRDGGPYPPRDRQPR